jgi:putative DNA primase/helicase
MNNIGAYIEEVAKTYWGEPTIRRGHTLRWGNNGSREVDLRKGTWFDFEANEGGGVIDLVKQNEGVSPLYTIPDILEKKFGIQKRVQESIKPARFMSACYDYVDENGEVKYQVQRFEPKTFRQRRPDEKGDWVYNMQGVEALPYRLPDIIAKPEMPIFVVEGEKAADKLAKMGLVATTNHGGAKNWKSELSRHFKGRRVVILPDNDEAGSAHADLVVSELFGVADMIKRVDLPDLPPKGDIVDWINAGNGLDAFMAIVKAAPVLESAPEAKPALAESEADSDLFDFVGAEYLRNMPPINWAIGEGDAGIITAHGLTVLYGAPGRVRALSPWIWRYL